MFGGYGNGNGGKDAFQFDLGGDWNGLSADATYGHADSVGATSARRASALRDPAAVEATLADVDAFTLSGQVQVSGADGVWRLRALRCCRTRPIARQAGQCRSATSTAASTGSIQKGAYTTTRSCSCLHRREVRPASRSRCRGRLLPHVAEQLLTTRASAAPRTPLRSNQRGFFSSGPEQQHLRRHDDVVSGMLDYRPVKRRRHLRWRRRTRWSPAAWPTASSRASTSLRRRA